MRAVSCVVVVLVAMAPVAAGCGSSKGPPPVDAAGGHDAAGSDVPVNLDAGAGDALGSVTSLFPAAGATAVCTDAPLRMVFDMPPTIGAAGMIRVFDAANPSAPVDTIDLAAATATRLIGGRTYIYKPIIITGDEAYIYLRAVLKPGATYYVNVDPGVFVTGAGGTSIGAVADATTWRFTVRAAPLAAGAAAIHVTPDGSGDFCTVQGAIDYIPAGNTTPVTITVARGTYREIVEIASKSNVTLHGEDRNESVISYPNNAALQTPPGGTSTGTKWRAMFGIDTSNDVVIENITLWNPSPQLSSNGQSETLRSEGSSRLILRNASFKGLQDTLLLTGQVYVVNSLIEGDVDFVWGNGVVYFDHCEIKDVSRKGYNVQARNGAGALGYTFVGCSLTADPGITGHYLARTDKNNMSPASQVAYIDCTMGPHITPAGWLIDGYTRPAADAGAPDGGPTWVFTGLRFQEYHSVDPTGVPVDVSQRIPESKQLSDAEAAQLRDVTYVLGGWNPRAATPDAGVD
jgi:pectin methylesterase-like acyl-CoA thioesterase